MEEQKATRKERIKTFFKIPRLSIKLFIIIIGICGLALWTTLGVINNKSIYEDCTVAGINLHGTLLIYTSNSPQENTTDPEEVVSSEDIILKIKQANENPNIKAIIIEVNSSGGSLIAGEEVFKAIKNSEKSVFAFIRTTGVSSSYLAISSADKIFASKYSEVGSIGVTMSFFTSVEKNQKEGYKYEELSSGVFKEVLSPNKPLTSAGRSLVLQQVNTMYQNFIKDVSENRNIPIEKVKIFADGSIILGEKAKELGLIDEIGGIKEVENYLEGQSGEKPNICWE